MHARRVVIAKKWLAGLLGVVAIEEVNDVGRDFLINGFRALQRSGPSSLPIWFFAVPSGDFIQSTGRGGTMHTPSLGSIAPGVSGIPGMGSFFMGGTIPGRSCSC